MKVYVKKEDENIINPIYKGIIIICLIVFLIGIILLGLSIYNKKESIELFPFVGMIIFSIVIGVNLTYLHNEKPTKYNAKLLSKENDTYESKDINYMSFLVYDYTFKEFDENQKRVLEPKEFKCYSIGENNLSINGKYNVYINGFTGKMEKVLEIDDPIKINK